jgi:D-amino-acid oxidase
MSQTTKLQTPDLSDDRILRVVSGLRPCRLGGLRLETVQLGPKTIVHNYGHGGCGITLSLGTAQAAADLVQVASSPTEPVAVLGAGVVGLTTARLLAQRGHSVTIYAKEAGVDTLSVLAGALFLPVGIEFDHPDIGQQRFLEILTDSKNALQQLDPIRFGIETLPVYEPEFAHDPEYLFNNGTIAPPVHIEKLPFPGPPRSGRSFESIFIHTPRFLNALIDDLNQLGVTIQNRNFISIDDINALNEQTIVNCLALGSRTVFGDEAMYPARGILVHMQPQPLGYIVHDGYKYMFPREDALILGGCFDENVWDEKPDQQIAEEILSHHRRFFALD